jgi:hypothetical protein
MKEIKFRFWFKSSNGFTQGAIYTINRINFELKEVTFKGYGNVFKFSDFERYEVV